MQSQKLRMSPSIVIQALIAAGVWFLVLDSRGHLGSSDPVVGRPLEPVANGALVQPGRLADALDRLATRLDLLAATNESPRPRPAEASAAPPEGLEVSATRELIPRPAVPDDLAAVLADLTGVLRLLKAKSQPLGGGRFDLSKWAARVFDREAVAAFRSSYLQNPDRAKQRVMLTPLTDLLRDFGRPSSVTPQEDGSENWNYFYDDDSFGTRFTVRDGYVIDVWGQ